MTEKKEKIISNTMPIGDEYKEDGEILSKVINNTCHEETFQWSTITTLTQRDI